MKQTKNIKQESTMEAKTLEDKIVNEIKNLKYKRTYTGHYTTESNGIEYSVRRNEITNEWHVYVDEEWSTEVDSLKQGKEVVTDKIINKMIG